jgi:trehalose-6-phosphate synthase
MKCEILESGGFGNDIGNGSVQLISVKIQNFQRTHFQDIVGNVSTKAVGAHIKFLDKGHVLESLRKISFKLIAVGIDMAEFGKGLKGSEISREVIRGESQGLERRQFRKLGRKGRGKLVVSEIQNFQVFKIPEPRRNSTMKMIVLHGKQNQQGQVFHGVGKSATDFVATKIESPQLTKEANLGRNGVLQAVSSCARCGQDR